MKQKSFASVWDAIEPSAAEAVNMRLRADLMIAIQESVASWKATQAVAAERLGLTQPRLNDLLRGRIDKFSLDALMNIATSAGLSVKLKVTRPAA